MPKRLESRCLDEITSRKAREVMRRTGAVVLPVGTVELHGPHMPMGCDGFITKAFAVKLAEKVDALVAPLESYSFIGATSRFAGGVSVPFSASMESLRNIVRGLIASGFKKIIIVSFHWPNTTAIDAVAREMFEETGIPVLGLRGQSVITDELVREVLGRDAGQAEESILCAGALKILGKLDLVDVASWKDKPYAPYGPASLKRLQKVGTIGYYFTDELSHVPPSAGVDPDKGAEIIDRAAARLKGVVADLDDYIKYLRKKYHRI